MAALPRADAAPVPRSAISAEPTPRQESSVAPSSAVPSQGAPSLESAPAASPVILEAVPAVEPTPAPAPLPAPVATQAAIPAPPPVEHKPEAVAAAAAPKPAPKWKDGTYFGWGTSRHGDIQAQVVVEGGRISATISQCRTRYPCSVIEMLPPEVAQRQSPEVDYVSRATQSANAFYFAVVDALTKAK